MSDTVVEKNCRACKYCYMEPSDMNFICGHPDAGTFGLYIHHATAPEGHCGPERPKFEQHSSREPNGDLKKRKADREKYPHINSEGVFYSNLMILHSGGGFYIGRLCFDESLGFEEPYSRESSYFRSRPAAELAMQEGFVVRDCIENQAGYESGDLPKLPTKPAH